MTSIAFPPDYAQPASSTSPTRIGGPAGGGPLQPQRREPPGGRQVLGARRFSPSLSRGPSVTAASSPSGRTAISTSRTGDGGPARDPRGRPEPRAAARQDPADRPGSAGYGIPVAILRRRPGQRRDLGVRPRRSAQASPSIDVSHSVGIADTGDERYEEIEYLPIDEARGANFGWPAYDGFVVLHGGAAPTPGDLPGDRLSASARLRGGRRLPGPGPAADANPRPGAERQLCLRRAAAPGKLFAFRPRAGRRAGKLRSFGFRHRNLTSLGAGQWRPHLRADAEGPQPTRARPRWARFTGSSRTAIRCRTSRPRRPRRRSPGCPPARTACLLPPTRSGNG